MPNQYGLVQFRDYLSDKKGKSHIKAADLDNNFRRLTPINPDHKTLFTIQEGGITFQTIELDVCVDGVAKKITVIGFGPY